MYIRLSNTSLLLITFVYGDGTWQPLLLQALQTPTTLAPAPAPVSSNLDDSTSTSTPTSSSTITDLPGPVYAIPITSPRMEAIARTMSLQIVSAGGVVPAGSASLSQLCCMQDLLSELKSLDLETL